MVRRLRQVRARAVEERRRLGAESSELLARLTTELADVHAIELVPVDKKGFLRGSRGELVVAEGCLYFDSALARDRIELLEVVAHEYGHLLLHHEQVQGESGDLIRGSVFLDNGVSALSRYSPRSQAEAEASAFAAELICPSADAFARWLAARGPIQDLATHYFAAENLIRLQLAEGLYYHLAGEDTLSPHVEVACTPDQETAATEIGCPVIVDAGPGTGKTKTLVRRVRYLIEDMHIRPEALLILTFSNEAADELRERLHQQMGADLESRILVRTFHGFGVILLHMFGQHIGLADDFAILDETAQEELFSELLGKVDCDAILNIKDPDETAAQVAAVINHLKDRLVMPSALGAALGAWSPDAASRNEKLRSEALHRLFSEYETLKQARNKLDFADLILLPEQLLRSNDDVRQTIRSEFTHVLVDEYQDVSRATALLLRQLCGEANPPWVVGDARQAIYRFRGAAPSNIARFDEDFQGSRRFRLAENYRSAPEIVAVANKLAAHLDARDGSPSALTRWRAAGSAVAHSQHPVTLATANCDRAEREGVVATVKAWLADDVAPENIAVLARRNVDVRNISVALNQAGIRAVTTGLLTAEGAAGDLTAVLTAVDHPAAGTRLVYALARDGASRVDLNSACTQLLQCEWTTPTMPDWQGPDTVRDLASQGWRILSGLRSLLHSGDGWHVLCDFLFFASPYLRELLTGPETAPRSVQLDEVLSTLATAAAYRFTHPHVRPRVSRLGLAHRLRRLVTHAAPGLVPPRATPGAVKVMTCHASKGLEFPFVAVAGQSLADIPRQEPMLPPSLRPDPNDDVLQAESLLFVGVTRAQRAVTISYSSSASGSPRSPKRRYPPLLTTLQSPGTVPLLTWTAVAPPSEEVTVGLVWGGTVRPAVSLYSLGSRTCRIRFYLEETLNARFRGRERPLYPEFVNRVRRLLRKVIELSIGGKDVSLPQIDQLLEAEWPAELYKDHPHVSLYRPRARRWALRMAEALKTTRGESFDAKQVTWADSQGNARTIDLQLLGHFRDRRGDRVAVTLQTGSHDKGPDVNWSELKDYHRLPFIFLNEEQGPIRPMIFYGGDGKLRSFRWSARKPDDARQEQLREARSVLDSLGSGTFDGIASDWGCDRCACRIVCPWWIGASD